MVFDKTCEPSLRKRPERLSIPTALRTSEITNEISVMKLRSEISNVILAH